MKFRTRYWAPASILLAWQLSISAPVYIANFNSFPAYPYNTSGYKQGGAFVGCGPTTGAMVFGYFQTVRSLTGLLTNPGTGVDNGLNTAWALHSQTYMKTKDDGFGDVYAIKPGLENYAKSKGYTVKVLIHVSSTYIDPNNASWGAYGSYGDAWTNDGTFWKQNAGNTWSIDSDKFCDYLATPLSQGIPVFLTIDTKAAGSGDHWVPLVGYDKSAKKYAYYDTYDTAVHWADIYYSGDPAGKKANSIVMVRTVAFTSTSTNPDIAVNWTSRDFGTIAVGDHLLDYLTVTNAGTSDLTVSNVTLSGTNAADFSIQNGGAFTLAAGNARQIGVLFSPSASGSRSASLNIASNDPDENPLVLGLTGTGGNASPSNPDIAVDWTSRNFGSIASGSNSTQYLTISNAGTSDLVVSSVDISGANASEFSASNNGPFTLSPGNAKQIAVKFTPSGTGNKTALLNLHSNDPDENPLTIPLSGAVSDGNAPQWAKIAELASGTVNTLAVMGNNIFAGTKKGGVFLSTNGTTWKAVNNGLANLDVRALLVSGPKVYAGTWGDGVYVSTDNGAQWTSIKSGLNDLYVACMAVDPPGVDGYQRLLAGTWGGGVFLSTNHGQAWTGVNTGITETHVRSVLLSGAHLFAGTIKGLFRSSDLGQSWNTIHNGLTNTAVISLNRRGTNLYAGTDGGGVFFSENDGDLWNGFVLNSGNYTIPDLAAFDITLFAATWGARVVRKVELGATDTPEEGLTEPYVRSLALFCENGTTGQWNILAGTENGNIWSWPLESRYPVVVDGTKDAFYNGLTGPSDGFLQLRSYAWNEKGKPDSDDDLCARIWTAWDDTWFYLYEEVTDNVVSGSAPESWEEDYLDLMFDPQPADSTVNSVLDARLTALDGATQSVLAWDNLDEVSGENAWRQWYRKTIPGGYALELAIQWQAVKSGSETITPQAGTEFGMAIKQHDNDGGAKRKAVIQWAAVMKDAAYNTPKYLGTVRLLADHKVQFIPKNHMTGVTNPVPYDGSDYIRTGVERIEGVPSVFRLEQNYPNPFNPSTTIRFDLPMAAHVRLSIYDLKGREIKVLVDENRAAGSHQASWNGCDAGHGPVPGGVYLYKLNAASCRGTGKLLLLK
jgi:hypothetical protein